MDGSAHNARHRASDAHCLVNLSTIDPAPSGLCENEYFMLLLADAEAWHD